MLSWKFFRKPARCNEGQGSQQRRSHKWHTTLRWETTLNGTRKQDASGERSKKA